MPLIMFSIFPRKPKNNRTLNLVFVHAPDEFLYPHKFGLGGGVEGFKCRLMRGKSKPLVPEKGGKYVGMKIYNHYRRSHILGSEVTHHFITAAKDFSSGSGA